MNWIVLFVAGLFEVTWAVGMKYSHGFTRFWPSVITVAAMVASVTGLAFAMRTLPLGTAYAVWTGIGAIGSVLVGIFLFGESTAFLRIMCLILIAAGIIGLRLTGAK